MQSLELNAYNEGVILTNISKHVAITQTQYTLSYLLLTGTIC